MSTEPTTKEVDTKLKIAELENQVAYYKRKCSIWISRYKWAMRHFVKPELEDRDMYNSCYGWSYPLNVDDSCNEIDEEYEESDLDQSDPDQSDTDQSDPEQEEVPGVIKPSSPPKPKPMLE